MNPNPHFCFDPARYRGLDLWSREWEIDLRHAQILFAVCAWWRPFAVVEIGSFRGSSTVAFVEAMRLGYVQWLHCIEPHPTAELFEVLTHAESRQFGRPRLSFVMTPQGARILSSTPNVVVHPSPVHRSAWVPAHGPKARCLAFIDGDHGPAALQDLAPFLAQSYGVIALHDTNPASPYAAQCIGSCEAARRLQERAAPPYAIAHDQERRAGERTERGLTIGFIDDTFAGKLQPYGPNVADRTQALMNRAAPWWEERITPTEPPPPAAA